MKHLLLAAAIVAGSAGIAHAQTDNDEINRGIKLFNDLEYQKSIEQLKRALGKQQNLTKQELTETDKYLAFDYLVLGNEAEAERYVKELLKLDPWFELDPMSSPRFLDFFAKVKKSMPPPPKRVATLTASGERAPVEMTYTTSPSQRAIKDAPLTFAVGIADPERRHARIVLLHRKKGAPAYSTVTARRVDNGRYEIIIPGLLVQQPTVEFYIAAEDEQGNKIGLLGSEQVPLAIDVNEPEGTPVYATWWFWTGIGAAVAAGVVTAIVLSGGSSNPPGGNTGTVIIHPQPQ
jgi:tetratricopeptide (TPR) repeat protein